MLTSSRSKYFLFNFLYFSRVSWPSFRMWGGCDWDEEGKGEGRGGGPMRMSLSGGGPIAVDAEGRLVMRDSKRGDSRM
jgi:hypothetical protein